MRPVAVFALSGLIAAASSTPAMAYLDPGTASIILQSIIGGAVMVGSVISIYWHKFKSLFTRSRPDPDKGKENL